MKWTSCRFPRLAQSTQVALVFMLLALGALVPAYGEQTGVSRDDAIAIVTQTVLGGSLDGVRLYIYPQLLPAGETVSTWKRDVFVTPATGWFLFLDLYPTANWEHACAYIFVDAATGNVQRYEAMVPPRLQADLDEITHGRDNPPPGASERASAWLDQRLKEVTKPAPPTRGQAYAFIISGGADQGNNHIRYWNDCSFIYKVLVNYYGYADDHIRVCISDGTNPAVDRSDGTNSPPDLDGDGDPDIEYPATLTYIDQVFGELAATLTASDQLFIFTTDHGGQESGLDCYLNLWNWEELRDDQMAAFVAEMPCETIICTFEQCFSGGMIDDLEGDGRIIATAARWDEYSWAMGPDYIWDTFVYHWTSAVGWATPSGQQVDADTNDDGLVSMHEAFLYAQANDFDDETPQYSSTPADLGDIVNLFGNLQGVYLAMDDMFIDDDALGASQGDGDGIIEFAETIELRVTLANLGMEDAFNVVGTLSSPSPYVAFGAAERSFGNIPSGGSTTNVQPFIFHVAHDVPNAHELQLTLALSEDPGSVSVGLIAYAPTYAAAILDVDDSVGGNGNGIAEPGESVVLTLAIQNEGGCDTPDLEAILGSGSAQFLPDETPHPIGIIPVSQGVTEGGFTVAVSATCPPVYAGYLHLVLRGPELYSMMVPLLFTVGQVFADNMEAGGDQWTHYAGPGGSWIDQWHLETYRNHTPAGTTSWKCGGDGAGTYGNLLHAILETDEFDLPAGSELVFWHWIAAEVSQAYQGYCYDGGLLQISTDGGSSWQGLAPDGGYPYRIRAGGTPGPFAAETPVWSGETGWQEVRVDLASYQGPVKLRWAFGSDGADVLEGWYLDDVRILVSAPSTIGGDNAGPLVLRPRLLAACPNPVAFGASEAATDGVAGSVIIRFDLPASAQAGLEIFDPSGRRIWSTAPSSFSAGVQQITWNGRDAAGQRVNAGSYFYRLTVGEQAQAGRLTVIR